MVTFLSKFLVTLTSIKTKTAQRARGELCQLFDGCLAQLACICISNVYLSEKAFEAKLKWLSKTKFWTESWKRRKSKSWKSSENAKRQRSLKVIVTSIVRTLYNIIFEYLRPTCRRKILLLYLSFDEKLIFQLPQIFSILTVA